MPKKKPASKVEKLLDELIQDHQGPEALLGENCLLKT